MSRLLLALLLLVLVAAPVIQLAAYERSRPPQRMAFLLKDFSCEVRDVQPDPLPVGYWITAGLKGLALGTAAAVVLWLFNLWSPRRPTPPDPSLTVNPPD